MSPGAVRVLMVVDAFLPESVGGSERVVHYWAKGLAARGSEVWVIAGCEEETLAGEGEAPSGYRVVRYPDPGRTFLHFYLPSIRRAQAAFRRLGARIPFDIIHCHHGLTAFALHRSGWGRGATVCTFHAPWHEEFESDAGERARELGGLKGLGYRLGARLKSRVIRRMERYSLLRCRGVAVLSRYSKERLLAVHPLRKDRVVVLPGGIDLERFSPASDRRAARRKLGWGEGDLILLTVRRLAARMGTDALLRAMPRVARDHPAARLVIGGRGPRERALKQLAVELDVADRVAFAGFIPEEELPVYYRAADLFVLPSRALEGFGMATLEALASGLPVLGTPSGATVEILQPLDPRLLASSHAPEDLAAAIGRLLADREGLRALGERARRWVEARYRWERSAEALEGYYRSLLSADARR